MKLFLSYFHQHVQQTPEHDALIGNDVFGKEFTLSYAELGKLVQQYAHFLRTKGVVKGDNIALITGRNIEMVIGMLACMQLGAVFVPFELTEGDSLDRFQKQLDKCRPKVILTNRENQRRYRDKQYGTVCLEEAKAHIESLQPDAPVSCDTVMPQDPMYIIFSSGSTGEPKGIVLPHAGVPERLEDAIKTFGWDALAPEQKSQHIRVGMYSSFFVDPCIYDMMLALGTGGSCYVISDELRNDTQLLQHYYHQHQITMTTMVPSVLQTLDPEKMSSLEVLVFTGEAADISMLSSWLKDGRKLINGFGPTEATFGMFYAVFNDQINVAVYNAKTNQLCAVEHYQYQNKVSSKALQPAEPPHALPEDQSRFMSIGREMQGVEVLLLEHVIRGDKQDNGVRERVAAGQEGEIYIRTAGLALKYLGQPELTDQRFFWLRPIKEYENRFEVISEGSQDESLGDFRVYQSGDRAVCLEDAKSLFYITTGRYDRQFKKNGRLIRPEEVELALQQYRDARGERPIISAVVGPIKQGEKVQIGCNLESCKPINHAHLRAYLLRTLDYFMVPSRWDIKHAPQEQQGTWKKSTKYQYDPSHTVLFTTRSQVDINGPLEKLIAKVWADLLFLEHEAALHAESQLRIKRSDCFYRLGGDSILYKQMMSILETEIASRARSTHVLSLQHLDLSQEIRQLKELTVSSLAQAIMQHFDYDLRFPMWLDIKSKFSFKI